MLDFRTWQFPLTPLPRTLVVVTAILLLVGTGGCDSISFLGGKERAEFSVDVDYEAIESGAVNVEQIDRGQYGNIVEGTRSVLRTQEAFASFWERLHADRETTPPRPEVDFDSQVVVAIVLGERSTGGYGTEIDEVLASEEGETIQVQYTEVGPGEGCVVTQVLTSPYVLVAVEAQRAEFTFSRSAETRSC